MESPFDSTTAGSRRVALFGSGAVAAGREVNTSICSVCYLTVLSSDGCSLADAELAHQCDESLIVNGAAESTRRKTTNQLHDDLRALIPRFIAHEVSGEERALLQVHIAFCADCRVFLGERQLENKHAPAKSLIRRQEEVLRLVATGMTHRQMVDVLRLSCKTVEFHKAALTEALGIRTTAELTRYAMAHGFVEPIAL